MSLLLFNLVKTLNKSEKSKFIKWSKIYSDYQSTEYFKLFDLIDKMEKYEEAELRSKLKTTHLASLKNYLYNSILKCLRTHAATTNTRVELMEYWTDTHLLLERGLVKQAYKRLEKAKKAAEKYHFDIISLELNFLERRLVRQSTKSNKIVTQKIEQLIKESNQTLTTVQEDFELLDLYEALFAKIRFDRKNLNESDYNLLYQPISPNLSLNGIICYYFANSMLATAQGKHQKKYELLQQLIKEFEQYEYLLKRDYDYQVRYIGFLNNYCVSCFRLNKLEEIPEVISKFDQINTQTDSFRLKSILFQRKNNLQTAYWVITGNYEALIEAVPEIESGIHIFKQNIDTNLKHTFYENFASAFLLKQDYKKATEYINKIINTPQTETKTRILMSAYRIELQILLSEKEYDVLNFRLIAFKRKFKNYAQSIDYKLATAIGKSINNLSNKALINLHEELKEQKGEEEIKKWLEQII